MPQSCIVLPSKDNFLGRFNIVIHDFAMIFAIKKYFHQNSQITHFIN